MVLAIALSHTLYSIYAAIEDQGEKERADRKEGRKEGILVTVADDCQSIREPGEPGMPRMASQHCSLPTALSVEHPAGKKRRPAWSHARPTESIGTAGG